MAFEDQPTTMQKYDTLLFDLDDTLYSLTTGFSKDCSKNIQEYMVQNLGVELDKVCQLNQDLYKNYGTSMAGLKAIGYDFDNDEYHSYVHGRLPYEKLEPDNVLRSLLLSLPLRKIIFSNADQVHVEKTLKKLGLEDCFEMIICFETLNPHIKTNSNYQNKIKKNGVNPYFLDFSSVLPKTPIICKPFKGAFELAFKLANINPQTTVFFDDSIRNIQIGKEIGLKTVLVGKITEVPEADYVVENIHNIKETLPELWEENENSNSAESSAENVAIGPSVIA